MELKVTALIDIAETEETEENLFLEVPFQSTPPVYVIHVNRSFNGKLAKSRESVFGLRWLFKIILCVRAHDKLEALMLSFSFLRCIPQHMEGALNKVTAQLERSKLDTWRISD